MTENDNTNENTNDTPVEAPESAPEAVEAPVEVEEQEQPENGNREAAKYRRQLRDVEAERDKLNESLRAAQNTILEAALARFEVQIPTEDPHAFRYKIFNSAAVRDLDLHHVFDDGVINRERVNAALAELTETKPYMFTGDTTRFGANSQASKAWGALIEGAIKKNLNSGDNFSKAFRPGD